MNLTLSVIPFFGLFFKNNDHEYFNNQNKSGILGVGVVGLRIYLPLQNLLNLKCFRLDRH